MQVYNVLANMDFLGVLSEANYQTETGKNLINKYQGIAMADTVNCTLVNNFLAEAKNNLYDSGVHAIYERLLTDINKNKYSWMFASACENIEANDSQYNFINKRAAKKVRELLEMKEDEIVSYVKAGALKDCMYCEAFRNIKNSIYKDMPIVESKNNYTKVHPVSIIEKNGDYNFFVAAGKLYKANKNEVSEAQMNEVSNDFVNIANFLSNCTIANETLTYTDSRFTININEQGKVEKIQNINGIEKKTVYTTEQFREHNSVLVNGILPNNRKQYAVILENVAKLSENFDNIALLDNVCIYTTQHDQFIVIEGNAKTYAALIRSNHASEWIVNENIYEVVNFIKSKAYVDLTEEYENHIENTISEVRESEGKQIKESLKQSKIDNMVSRIEQLTEKFKDKPAQLAVLSEIAQRLQRGELEEDFE